MMRKSPLTFEQAIEKAYDDGWHEGWSAGARQALQFLTAGVCLALTDLYGFKQKRLYKVVMRMNQELLPSTNHLTSQEAAEEVLAKSGLELVFDNPLDAVRIRAPEKLVKEEEENLHVRGKDDGKAD